MSLADKFDHQVEPAFSHGVDLESARRQLRMSIMLVAAIGVAAFLLESSIGTQFPANQLTRSEGPGVFRRFPDDWFRSAALTPRLATARVSIQRETTSATQPKSASCG